MAITYVQPDVTTMTSAAYKAALDAATKVMSQIGAAFAPHEAAAVNMTAVIDAGTLRVSGTTLNVAQQTTGTLVAPVSNPRDDRLAIREIDGVLVVFPGAENAVPVAPVVPLGYMPIARIRLTVGMSTILNSSITDERAANRVARLDASYYGLERATRSGRLMAALNLT